MTFRPHRSSTPCFSFESRARWTSSRRVPTWIFEYAEVPLSWAFRRPEHVLSQLPFSHQTFFITFVCMCLFATDLIPPLLLLNTINLHITHISITLCAAETIEVLRFATTKINQSNPITFFCTTALYYYNCHCLHWYISVTIILINKRFILV